MPARPGPTTRSLDPGGQPTDATSATSVVYNASAGLFFAAIRYHGFYSSPDGVTWTRLASQPGGSVARAPAPARHNPPRIIYACPIYRGEITVVPGRNEMYAWFVSLDSNGSTSRRRHLAKHERRRVVDSISDTGITNCGDSFGCGVEQGSYNLELLAVPNVRGHRPVRRSRQSLQVHDQFAESHLRRRLHS